MGWSKGDDVDYDMVFNHPRNTVGWRVNGPCLKGATTNLGNFSIPNNTLIMISCQLVPGFRSQEKVVIIYPFSRVVEWSNGGDAGCGVI